MSQKENVKKESAKIVAKRSASSIDKKDAMLGILLIAVVGLSGGLGFLILQPSPAATTTPTTCPECPTAPTTVYLSGLPDDWSTAPNSSYIMLYNQTDNIKINLSMILDGIRADINDVPEYIPSIRLKTVQDPISKLYVTGADVCDVLAYHHTYFAGDMSFLGKENTYGIKNTLNMSAYQIVNKMYEDDEDVIIALAANKTWLKNSPIGSYCGNFSIFGQNMPEQLNNLEKIDILNNWTIEIEVDGVVELTLDHTNLTVNPVIMNWSFEDNTWWNWDRQHWGQNISTLVNYTSAKGKLINNVTFEASDGYKQPKSSNPYNITDVHIHLPNNGTHIIGDHVDLVNNSVYKAYDGVPLPATNLRMLLVYMNQEFGEYGPDGPATADPIWPYPNYKGYDSGPYQLVVPGRIRSQYLSHIVKIIITTT